VLCGRVATPVHWGGGLTGMSGATHQPSPRHSFHSLVAVAPGGGMESVKRAPEWTGEGPFCCSAAAHQPPARRHNTMTHTETTRERDGQPHTHHTDANRPVADKHGPGCPFVPDSRSRASQHTPRVCGSSHISRVAWPRRPDSTETNRHTRNR